jgi:hypothetical protein
MITLVEFSHYTHMSPFDLWKSLNYEENSPFRPLV